MNWHATSSCNTFYFIYLFWVTYCKFFTAFCDKNTCRDLILIKKRFFNKIFWRYSLPSYMFHISYLYIINQCIYTLCTLIHIFIKVWTQDFMIHVSYIIFIHDTSMNIHITYINAHIHQGLNPRLHGDAPKSSPPNHFKSLIK